MASMNVRSGDLVEIIVGNDDNLGKRGKVITANHKKNTVIVENLNMATKHRKPRSAQDNGGKVEMPRAIDVSNVMIVCPKCDKATRVGHVLIEGSTKYARSCKKCGANIDAKETKKAVKAAKKTTKTAKKADKAE